MHHGCEVKKGDFVNGTAKITLCTGETIAIRRNGTKLIFTYQNSKVTAPLISPLSKKAFLSVSHELPNALMVWYGSSWPEYQMMSCAAGVVILNRGKLEKLPNVKPDTWVDAQIVLPQLIIGRVEKTPFRAPCGALLDTSDLDENLQSSYIFPCRDPIIIEGFAATNAAGRVHCSTNLPGTGATYGDVPFLYPWTSPDKKRHGWALTLHHEWEIRGKERPFENQTVLQDRCIDYDATGEDEEFDIILGSKHVPFARLKGLDTGWSQITSYRLKLAAYESLKHYLGVNSMKHCRCPLKEPQVDAIQAIGWFDPKELADVQ